VRGYPRRVLVAVRDDGVGVERDTVRYRCGGPLGGSTAADGGARRPHGMQIVAEQLCLLYGYGARLRLFGRPDVGTCVVFTIPRMPAPAAAREATAEARAEV